MPKRIIIIFTLLFSGTIFSGCLEETNETFDEKSFTRIFDNSLFSASYYPIDMVQTPDGGYLIVGGRKLESSNLSGIYLLKADKFGNFVSDLEVAEQFVNPVASLMPFNGGYAFLCMDALTLQAHIALTDENASAVEMTPVNPGSGNLEITYYPAAATLDNNTILMLSYASVARQSVVSVINTNATITSFKGFTIGAGDDVEEPLIKHYLRTGRQFPFQVGRSGSLYYFNGFYEYTFSMVFTDLNQDEPNGVVQGQQENGGFSALSLVSGNTFAAARFNFGENYLLPRVTLNTSGFSSSVDLEGNNLPELDDNTTVRILRASLNGKSRVIYGSDTRSKQIGLYFYDEATGEFMGSKYIGYSYPFEIANVIQTEDGGLAVCGTAYVAGRFPRFCLVKLSTDELKNL